MDNGLREKIFNIFEWHKNFNLSLFCVLQYKFSVQHNLSILDMGLQNQLSIKHNGAYSSKHISLHEILQKGLYMLANRNNLQQCVSHT